MANNRSQTNPPPKPQDVVVELNKRMREEMMMWDVTEDGQTVMFKGFAGDAIAFLQKEFPNVQHKEVDDVLTIDKNSLQAILRPESEVKSRPPSPPTSADTAHPKAQAVPKVDSRPETPAADEKSKWIEGESYMIQPGRNFHSPWDVYTLYRDYAKEPDDSDSVKVHLSFDQTQLPAAREKILEVLKKYKLHNFKIIHETSERRNVMGKEVTIYMQIANDYKTGANEKDPDFWIKVFNELEDSLTKAKIGPNKQFKSQGDKLFPGSSGFIYYRNPENIIKRYIAADHLARAGFTNAEAFNLCPPDHDPVQQLFKSKRLHLGQDVKNVAPDSPKNISQDRKITIPSKFSDDIAKQQRDILDYFKLEIARLQGEDLFFGKPVYQDKEKVKQFENLALIFKLAFGYGGYDIPDDISAVKDISNSLRQFFMECFNEAAEYVAKARACLSASGIPLPDMDSIGNIVPAVYNHMFTPILAEWIKNPNTPFTNIVNKQAFIKDVFKCAFRDKKVAQIELDSPQYVAQISDKQLNELFNQLNPTISLKAEASPTLTKDFAIEVRAEAIKIAQTANPNVREQLAKAFTYLFEKILPLDKKENGLLTREGNIDPNEVAKLINLYKENNHRALAMFLLNNPSYGAIAGLLSRTDTLEEFVQELNENMNEAILSLPAKTAVKEVKAEPVTEQKSTPPPLQQTESQKSVAALMEAYREANLDERRKLLGAALAIMVNQKDTPFVFDSKEEVFRSQKPFSKPAGRGHINTAFLRLGQLLEIVNDKSVFCEYSNRPQDQMEGQGFLVARGIQIDNLDQIKKLFEALEPYQTLKSDFPEYDTNPMYKPELVELVSFFKTKGHVPTLSDHEIYMKKRSDEDRFYDSSADQAMGALLQPNSLKGEPLRNKSTVTYIVAGDQKSFTQLRNRLPSEICSITAQGDSFKIEINKDKLKQFIFSRLNQVIDIVDPATKGYFGYSRSPEGITYTTSNTQFISQFSNVLKECGVIPLRPRHLMSSKDGISRFPIGLQITNFEKFFQETAKLIATKTAESKVDAVPISAAAAVITTDQKEIPEPMKKAIEALNAVVLQKSGVSIAKFDIVGSKVSIVTSDIPTGSSQDVIDMHRVVKYKARDIVKSLGIAVENREGYFSFYINKDDLLSNRNIQQKMSEMEYTTKQTQAHMAGSAHISLPELPIELGIAQDRCLDRIQSVRRLLGPNSCNGVDLIMKQYVSDVIRCINDAIKIHNDGKAMTPEGINSINSLLTVKNLQTRMNESKGNFPANLKSDFDALEASIEASIKTVKEALGMKGPAPASPK